MHEKEKYFSVSSYDGEEKLGGNFSFDNVLIMHVYEVLMSDRKVLPLMQKAAKSKVERRLSFDPGGNTGVGIALVVAAKGYKLIVTMPLKVLDLSFNNLSGGFPSSFNQFQLGITLMFLTNNMLQGPIPSWNPNSNLDLSYNNFKGKAPKGCQLGSIYSEMETWLTVVHDLFFGILNKDKAYFIAPNASVLNMSHLELYTEARVSRLLRIYYDLCIQKGNYTVNLHFAEIVLIDDQSFLSAGRRLFSSVELQTSISSLRQIKITTKNFDSGNEIGEGVFGPVYKGILPDCSVIAVKQLSSTSRQGNHEFVNDIRLISALQHPNLVKLYGCCIEGN